jgi:hypothetical protein
LLVLSVFEEDIPSRKLEKRKKILPKNLKGETISNTYNKAKQRNMRWLRTKFNGGFL